MLTYMQTYIFTYQTYLKANITNIYILALHTYTYEYSAYGNCLFWSFKGVVTSSLSVVTRVWPPIYLFKMIFCLLSAMKWHLFRWIWWSTACATLWEVVKRLAADMCTCMHAYWIWACTNIHTQIHVHIKTMVIRLLLQMGVIMMQFCNLVLWRN